MEFVLLYFVGFFLCVYCIARLDKKIDVDSKDFADMLAGVCLSSVFWPLIAPLFGVGYVSKKLIKLANKHREQPETSDLTVEQLEEMLQKIKGEK